MELLQIIRERVNGRKSAGSWILLIVIVGGYLIFLTSRLWMPRSTEYVEPTPLYVSQTFGERGGYISRWEYSEAEQAMQIVLEIESKAIVDQKISFAAVERSAGELDITAAVEQTDYIVFYITEIPEKWTEISLRLWGEDESDMLRLYTNVDSIEYVNGLPGTDRTACEVYRLEGQIRYDTYRISEREGDILALQEENESLQERISELEGMRYPTEEEAQEAGETVSRAESRMESNNTQIRQLQEEIDQLKKRSESIEEQIREVESEGTGE